MPESPRLESAETCFSASEHLAAPPQQGPDRVDVDVTGAPVSWLRRLAGDRAPLAVALGVAGIATAVVPWMARPLGSHPGFLPAMLSIVLCLDLLSVYLLLAQFRIHGNPRALAMGWAYTWSLITLIGYAFALPGIIWLDPPFATAASVPPWLYVIWHVSFPTLLALAWVPWPARFLGICPPRRRRWLIWVSQFGALLTSGTVVVIVVARGTHLPVLIEGLDTSRMTSLTAPVAVPLVLISAGYTAWALRGNSGPERWTSIAVWVCLIDLILTYSAQDSFSLGWYAGRVMTVVAAALVLFAMLHETKDVKLALAAALERQREVELLQHTVMNNLSTSVILSDPSGVVTMVNDATRALFPEVQPGQKPPRVVLRKPHGTLIPAPEWPTASTARTGEPRRDVVFTVSTRDGEQMWLSANTTAVPGPDGRPVGVVSSYTDITDRERSRRNLEESARQVGLARDAAVAATLAKSAFQTAMSQEIRTPLNAVIGMTGLLLDTELDDVQRDFTEHVRSSGEALLAIVNDVLDFSKIEANELELESDPFNVRECVESALTLLAVAASDKGIELMAHLQDGCPELVIGDVTRFRQVIVNLLTNAVKFTTHGEVVVTVSAMPSGSGPVDGQGERPVILTVSVRDTGIGIHPERMGLLFQPFSQGDSSITRGQGGTGLGLVISQRLAKAMAGDLLVTSRHGVGSTFTFTARLHVSHERRGAPARPSLGASLVGRTVLIVDDNATNRSVLHQLLNGWGMICTDAATPGAALEIMKATDGDSPRFDIAILDMHMPEMDGAHLADELRLLPAGRDLPLVLLSSLQGRLSTQPLDQFAATLTKPVRSMLLRAKLLQILTPAEHLLAALETAGGRRVSDGPPPAPTRPLRILMAEDNVVNQKVATGLLTKLGHRVDTVNDGREAVQAVRLASYDVVLMDLQIPELDGLGATKQIRQQMPADEQPFIVALTANVLAEDRAACLAAGMDAFLAKPIRLRELQDLLSQAGSQARPRVRPSV